MDEEKRRLQSTREEVGDSSGGRRIDFEAGKVTISRGGKAAVADPDEATPDQDENPGQDQDQALEANQSDPEADATDELAVDDAENGRSAQ